MINHHVGNLNTHTTVTWYTEVNRGAVYMVGRRCRGRELGDYSERWIRSFSDSNLFSGTDVLLPLLRIGVVGSMCSVTQGTRNGGSVCHVIVLTKKIPYQPKITNNNVNNKNKVFVSVSFLNFCAN